LQKVFGAHARTLTFTAHRRNCRKEPAPDELIAPELLTVPQAAARLGVKPRTLWKWIYEHEIESVLLGRLRKVRIAAIDECIDRHTVKADNAQSRRVRKPARMRRDA
jgi:excisionase family DNA binding protein